MSDEQLLAQYVCDGCVPAFAQLVERHLGRVYRLALRQVRSSAVVEAVAQRVFTEFVATARRLPCATMVVA